MSALQWREATHAQLAELLRSATLEQSRAVGPATLYQMQCQGRDILAISLPQGQALLVETGAPARTRRRRADQSGA